MRSLKGKFFIALAICLAFVWGTSYLLLPGAGAEKHFVGNTKHGLRLPTLSQGAYTPSPVAAKPDKVEGYTPARRLVDDSKKFVRGREGGEDCSSATPIGSLPYYDTGYTCDNVDDYDEVCPYSGSTSPDVVYSYSPAASEMVNIDLGGSYYDTKVYVYENTCASPYYACNDDYYADYTSAIMNLDIYAGNTYYIVVDGYGGDCGDYVLNVTTVEPCDVVCPDGGIPEGEETCYDYYVDTYNGGCNSTPNVFQDIDCGDVICGTSGTFYMDGNYRDTDWFRITLTDPATITWWAVGEFPMLIFIIAESDCANPNILGSATADMCDTASLTMDVPAGVYWLWVGPSVFEGYDCGVEYVAKIECEVATTGACCYDFDPYTCTIETPADCAAMPDHTFQGLGTNCGPPNPCIPGPDNDDCEDAIEIFPPDCPTAQTVYGSTIGAQIDCPGVLDWPAVWYKFTLTYASSNVFIDFCAMTIDLYSIGAVIFDHCPIPDCYDYILYSEGAFVDCPNGTYNGQLWYNNLPPGTYWLPIYVEDPGGNMYMDFAFNICVEEVEPCDVVCPGDGIPEEEPICTDDWEDVWNGGCNSYPYVFEDATCNTKICGTSGTYLYYGDNYRDTDWFRLDLTQAATITWKAVGEFPMLIFVIDAGTENCSDYTILGSATADECDTASLTFDLPVGVYWLWVGPSVFAGYPCGVEYVAEIACEIATTGACCNDFEPWDCQETTESYCNSLPDHTFLGLGTNCGPPNPCEPGNTCDNPIQVDLPADLDYSDLGQYTCGRGNNYSNTCLGYYDGGEDIIYQLNVTSPVDVDVLLDPKSSTWTGIALDDDCPLDPSTCLYTSTNSSASPHGFTGVHLEAGTYYIMVDTWPSPDCIPEFDLFIIASSGPQPGDNCGLPIEVELPAELPYLDREQTNCFRNDNYSETCLGYYDGGEDIIYEVTVTEPVYVLVTLDPKTSTYTGIALDDVCPPDDECLYISTSGYSSDPHGFMADLDVGTYYIMIDTWPSPDCIPDFDLTIDPLGPEIELSPASLEQVLNPDPPCNTADEIMNVTNTGYMDLNYSITENPEVAWLSCTPTSGIVSPDMTDPVTVSFDASGMAPGVYNTELVVASDAVNDPEVHVPVQLTVELAPDISLEPTAMEMGVIPGCEMYRSVRVHNAGPGELRFEASVGEAAPTLTMKESNVHEALQALREAGKANPTIVPREAYKVMGAKRLEVEYISTNESEGLLLLAGKGEKADILLVDDDGGTPGGTYYDIEDIYMDALDAGGYVYDYYNVDWSDPLSDGPDLSTMQPYQVVIWFCGETWGYYGLDVLTANDEANLGSYLDGGGNLFLSAQDWLWASYPSAGSFSPGTFPYDYLHLASVDQDVINDPYTCTGLPGSVAEGMEFQTERFTDNPDVPLWTDYLTTQSSAAVDVFDADGGVSAIQYNPAKGYKVVFTTTAFPGLVDASPSTRAELMASIMDWFLESPCPFTVYPEEGTVPAESFFDVVLTFDGTAFEECVDETATCYLVISSNDCDDPVVSTQVDMWSGRGDVHPEPPCLRELGDVLFMINFVWRGGPAPDPPCMGDCNRDGIEGDVEDVMYLIQYLYQGGPPPVAAPPIDQPIKPTQLERK